MQIPATGEQSNSSARRTNARPASNDRTQDGRSAHQGQQQHGQTPPARTRDGTQSPNDHERPGENRCPGNTPRDDHHGRPSYRLPRTRRPAPGHTRTHADRSTSSFAWTMSRVNQRPTRSRATLWRVPRTRASTTTPDCKAVSLDRSQRSKTLDLQTGTRHGRGLCNSTSPVFG